MRLKNKIALVTGAGKGIGRDIAIGFAREGAHVVINYHTDQNGAEEIDEIIPAIQAAKANGVNALGPTPADTIFVRAKAGDYDAVIALYHDQGTAASKLLGFGRVVTLLAGIPIIRTSVGHGTAFDIAGRNKADHLNLAEAIKVAAELAERRTRVKA